MAVMNFIKRFWPFNQKTQPTKGSEMNPATLTLALNVLPLIVQLVQAHPNGADIWKMLTGEQSSTFWNGLANMAAANGHASQGAPTIQAIGMMAPLLGQLAPVHTDAAKAVQTIAAVAPVVFQALPQAPDQAH